MNNGTPSAPRPPFGGSFFLPAAVRRTGAGLVLAVLASFAVRGGIQDPAADPAGRAITHFVHPQTGDRAALTLAEYQAYLFELYGKGDLGNLVYRRVLEGEAIRLALSVPRAAADDTARAEWDLFVEMRFGGDAEAAAAELIERGFTVQHYLARLTGTARQAQLEDAIARATRVVGEDNIAARFDAEYGKGGERVEVRHVFLNRARMQQDLVRAGRKPDELTSQVIDREIEALLRECLVELEAGATFDEIAERTSHDLASKARGGLIEGYNYDRFGDDLASAVRTAAVEQPFGPIRGPAGWHIARVDSRVLTQLDDVRAAIIAALEQEPSSPMERGALQTRLMAAAAREDT